MFLVFGFWFLDVMGSPGSGRQRAKRPNSFADFLVQFRWVVIVPIVLPLSFLFYQYIQWRATIRRLIHGPPSEEKHRRAIKKVQDRIKSRHPQHDGMICTARRPWLEVSMRYSEHKRSHRFEVDLSHLTDIVWVDKERMLIKCEPMVCMSEVSAAVLPLGMAPQVLPELDDLTVGGVINGYGIEGSSHLFGLFSDTCVAYELVLADGSLVRATADNEYSDLFHAVPWSHGSIGLLVGAEFRLTPVKEYMKVTYSPVSGNLDEIASHYLESFRPPQKNQEEKVPDFVETMIFDATNAVITTGRYASREEATRKGNVINEIGWWYKPWFYTHVATALKRGKFVEYVPAREYHHRHTRSLYWEGALIVPMGNHPLFRFFLGWLMPPKVSLLKLTMTRSLRSYYEQRHACQDMLIPSRKIADCLKFCHDNFETYPLWVAPHRLPKKRMGTMLDCEPEYEKDMQAADTEEGQMWTDVGIWTVPLPVLRNEVWDGIEATKSMEKWLRDNRSYQCLYAVSEQSEEEFWKMFDKTLYDAVRKKYGAECNFMSVYYKISKSKKGKAYSNPPSLKKLH